MKYVDLLGLDTAWHQLPEVTVTATKNKAVEQTNSINPWGPILILAGTKIDFLKPVGALGSKSGSSIASYTLSKALPVSHRVIKKVSTKVLGKRAGSAVLGRFLGRLVPYAGWASSQASHIAANRVDCIMK